MEIYNKYANFITSKSRLFVVCEYFYFFYFIFASCTVFWICFELLSTNTKPNPNQTNIVFLLGFFHGQWESLKVIRFVQCEFKQL